MLKSMTGYAHVCDCFYDNQFEITVKSLNSKYLDCFVKINNGMDFLEPIILKKLKSRVNRGKIEVVVCFKSNSPGGADRTELLKKALDFSDLLREIKSECNISGKPTLTDILRCPNLFEIDTRNTNNDELTGYFCTVFDRVFDDFTAFRENEGKILERDVTDCCTNALVSLDEIKKAYPKILSDYKMRLEGKIKNLLNTQIADEQRILTEVAILADKTDIHEEIIRLKNHLEAILSLLDENKPVGKRLNFILQEANREINTIGSKISDVSISSLVIDIKTEIEKMREQAQNIE